MVGNFTRFTVHDFHDLAKFMKFSICKMFPLIGTRLILNKILTFQSQKSLILNKVTKYTSTKSSILNKVAKFSSATFSHYVYNTHIRTL